MSKKISHSAWNKYLTCPKLYDIHYNERLRPNGTSSALVFGTAMDEALNHLLLTKDLEQSIIVFRDNMKWEDMDEVSWDARDLDYSLVPNGEFEDDDKQAWATMRVKGRMLLEAYNKSIIPLVEEVESVQKELRNRPGFIDTIVKLRGHGRVLLDNKTSARRYLPDAVANSTQLALYAHDQGIKKIGFAVLVKQIKKNTVRLCLSCGYDGSYVRHKTCPNTVNGTRCHGAWDESHSPEAEIQLFVESTSGVLGGLVVESMSETERAIKDKVFPRNLNACGKMYGKPCPYIDYCHKGRKDGLEHKPEGEKK